MYIMYLINQLNLLKLLDLHVRISVLSVDIFLSCHKLAVNTVGILLEKSLMISLFSNLAVLQHKNIIGISDC